MNENCEAYQKLKEYMRKNNLEEIFRDKYVSYANGNIVCLKDDLEHLKTIGFLNRDNVVYFRIGEDVMHKL